MANSRRIGGAERINRRKTLRKAREREMRMRAKNRETPRGSSLAAASQLGTDRTYRIKER